MIMTRERATAIEVRKKEGESPNALLYRFTKKVKQSGLLLEAKKRRFRTRQPNKRSRRLSALHREQKRKERERLSKWGML
jgi:ribosomal protein S21